ICGPRDVTVSNGASLSQPCVSCVNVSSNSLTLSEVIPSSLHRGDGPVDVTIHGAGFTADTIAKIRGTRKISQTFVDCGTIILTLEVPSDTSLGFKRVKVKNSSDDVAKRRDIFQIN